MTFTLDDAIRIATEAHSGQTDKSGQPYITHPLRVMDNVEGEHHKMAAVLHDVIEDTPVTAADLASHGCPPVVVEAVVALSRGVHEHQEDYLTRVVANPIAVVVKRADIADNASPVRIDQLDPATRARLKIKYDNALRFIDNAVTNLSAS